MNYILLLTKIINSGYIVASTVILIMLFLRKSNQIFFNNLLSLGNIIFLFSSAITLISLLFFKSGFIDFMWLIKNALPSVIIFSLPHFLGLLFAFKKLNTNRIFTIIVLLFLAFAHFIPSTTITDILPYPGQGNPTSLVMPIYEIKIVYLLLYLILLVLVFRLKKGSWSENIS